MALAPLIKELWAIFCFLQFKYQIYYRKFSGPIKNILENCGFREPLTADLGVPSHNIHIFSKVIIADDRFFFSVPTKNRNDIPNVKFMCFR